MPTAFSYHRVSTNVQDTKEQVKGNGEYAEEKNITVLNEYGDQGKRHHARNPVDTCRHPRDEAPHDLTPPPPSPT